MNWYVIDKSYVKYLLQYDSKVGNVEYSNKLKLHIGILLETNGYKYYVPVSSPKPKHSRMKNSIDFHKVLDPKDGMLYAVINLNNMIPVPDGCVTQLKYDKVSQYRYFADQKEETNYIYLLQKEKGIIDSFSDILESKAKKLRWKVEENPASPLAQRCCNFSLLEELSKKYPHNGSDE